jgi:acetyl-CoA carboxylase biotin carboxyl carrier protein
MNIEEIKKLLRIMEEHDLAEIEIEEEGKRTKLRKKESPKIMSIGNQKEEEVVGKEVKKEEENISFIKAPMVGTFYRAPAPDAPAFAEVGDIIEKGKTICIIEAMKLMNEIKSDNKCKVLEVLVENGDPVEYGQPLFKIELV